MSQKLKKRMITLKTLSLPNQFFVLVKDYISSQEIIFDHNKRKEFEYFLKEIKYVAGFEIRQDLKSNSNVVGWRNSSVNVSI